MKKREKISNFVESEITKFRNECHFTEIELKFFELKSNGKSNIEITFELGISERTAVNLSKAVNNKIIKVL